MDELPAFLKILARSATGQKLTVYTNLIWPGQNPGDASGPAETHVVLLDNGRGRLLASKAAEMMACIRCGACLNSCPIYKAAGGHAYGGTYPGPMGSILSPMLGARQGKDLAAASTLCGACKEACPVRIDIPRLLQLYRSEPEYSNPKPLFWRLALKAFGLAASHPFLYRLLRLAVGLLPSKKEKTWKAGGSGLLPGWSAHRDLKLPAAKSFLKQWKDSQRGKNG
jgi:L-lactate dehydrogenase complex protein LldF